MSDTKKTTLKIPAQKTPFFSFPAHTITWESFPSTVQKTLSPKDAETFFALHALASTRQKKGLKLVEKLVKSYPTQPEVLNLATSICLSHYRTKQADDYIERNYRFNAENFFAKINCADLRLRQNQVSAVPPIFCDKKSPQELYPERKVFHVSEFRGFLVVMGLYYLATDHKECAFCCHYLAHKVDPHHPSTRYLQKKLFQPPSLLQRWFPRFFPEKS